MSHLQIYQNLSPELVGQYNDLYLEFKMHHRWNSGLISTKMGTEVKIIEKKSENEIRQNVIIDMNDFLLEYGTKKNSAIEMT